ncbi:MAG: hydrogenase expression/formation protein HypE [Deltaproteobacteria bacterium]|nr:MAG: hydrogenase expression/formation protein HypE [Deltaproteobacteria bacterium]
MSAGDRSDLSRGPRCPLPIADHPTVLLAHGGGGRLSRMLLDRVFLEAFRNPILETLHDGALLDLGDARVVVSTDSFVIRPLFFPGGDIGSLAVHGTVNDVAMCGAKPVGLCAGFILEEGLPMETLWQIACSMQEAAREVGASIVTGDTKVVDRGKGDGVFINTTGLGVLLPGADVSPLRARAGDVVLVNGSLGLHGVAVMSIREGLEFETALESDSAPLCDLVRCILERAGNGIHVLRDPTRGGVASALNEIAAQARVGIRLDERGLPIREEVRGACEILGLDPLYVANEGKCLAIVARERADEVLETLHAHPLGDEAAIIGEVVDEHPGRVVLRTRIGGTRFVDMLSGDPLPRIC